MRRPSRSKGAMRPVAHRGGTRALAAAKSVGFSRLDVQDDGAKFGSLVRAVAKGLALAVPASAPGHFLVFFCLPNIGGFLRNRRLRHTNLLGSFCDAVLWLAASNFILRRKRRLEKTCMGLSLPYPPGLLRPGGKKGFSGQKSARYFGRPDKFVILGFDPHAENTKKGRLQDACFSLSFAFFSYRKAGRYV